MDVMMPYTLVILQIWYTDVVYYQSNFPLGLVDGSNVGINWIAIDKIIAWILPGSENVVPSSKHAYLLASSACTGICV